MLQKEALDILKLGHNVYLTGAAGSGKTFVLNEFIDYLNENGINVGITASTGIAATHMNGMTIHSWAGIGINEEISDQDLEKMLSNARLKKRFKDAKVLIIDEVSMLHGARLDIVNNVARAFKDESKAFGGLQVVLCGDLFQLPPISRGEEPDFVFMSDAWNNMNLKICYLGEQYRQEDQRLLDVLGAIRANEVDDSHFEYLQQRFKEVPSGKKVTRLYTHNKSVDSINENELSQIDKKTKTFNMSLKGNKQISETLAKNCLAPEILELKVGAEVMFVANNPLEHYVNGTRGEVIDFSEEGLPMVKTGMHVITVEQHSWKMEDGERTVAEVSQIPLRLAWAITVHKSQGMSLDAAEIDLSKSFEPGMGYVALSRVKDLDGMYIKGINNTALAVNPNISKLDISLKSRSDKAKAELKTISDIRDHHKRVRLALRSDEEKMLDDYDKDIFQDLKTWRTGQAKKQSAPAYIVLSDKTLKLIAATKPKNRRELARTHGMGAKKLDDYGDAILAIINNELL